MLPNLDYRRVADPRAAALAALELLLQQAAAAIAQRGRFVLALSGGSTPQLLYQLLATAEQDWNNWILVYGDERCLPYGNPERTSTLVEQCWLNVANFPRTNHYLPALEPGADIAALAYAETIASLLPIDVALLGMGEDGHTASLFPGHSHSQQSVVPVHNSPKPPADRISLSYATLNAAAVVCFLVTGQGKQATLQRWLAGAEFPVANIHGKQATVLITDVAL